MDSPPVFSALSTSARQLYLLLRCISFAPRAEIQITPQGLRFSAEESHAVQGLVFVESNLFSSFTFNTPADGAVPCFQISLSALLETLQIFGIAETTNSHRNQNGGFSSSYGAAFNTPALALGGTCRISYPEMGSPLSITIQEAGVTTTCDLTTYDPPAHYDNDDGIPLDRNALALKIIMRSTWLHDAIIELSATSPNVLLLNASSTSAPYLALEGHGGPFGDSTVDFMPDSKNAPTPSNTRSKKQPLITETFSVSAPTGSHGRVKQRYKFDLIKKAGRAMALASKVSLRQDRQGVLSLQFMIEIGESGIGGSRDGAGGNVINAGGSSGAGGKVSFVDFRFVPLLDEDDDDEDGEEDRGESTASEE